MIQGSGPSWARIHWVSKQGTWTSMATWQTARTDATDPSGLMGGGDAQSQAALGAFYNAHPNYYLWCYPSTPGVPTLDDILNSIDALAAGLAGNVTGGATTRMRASTYGEIATQNHSGTAFQVGDSLGAGINLMLGFSSPCAMGKAGSMGYRGLMALSAAGDAANAGESYNNGDYLGAGLSILGALGSFGDMLQSCFAAGTPLLTPDGSKPIDQLRPGDWVLAAPDDDPEAPPEPRRVEEVFENYSPLLELRIDDRTICTTAEHPFWVRGRGWIAAHQLVAGDLLRSHDGQWVALGSVVGNLEAKPVYNLQIEEYHTYFVGDRHWGFSIWSHNYGNYTQQSRTHATERGHSANAPRQPG